MKSPILLVFVMLVFPCLVFPQQKKNVVGQAQRSTSKKSITSKTYVSVADTSENGLVDKVMRMMDYSGTVIRGELISKKSHWRVLKNPFYPRGDSEIYTIYTFKVARWIKGSMQGNEVSYWQWGGKIGDTKEIVTPVTHYDLNLKGFFFFGNKKPNTQWIERGVIQTFGAVHGRSGQVFIGEYRVNPDFYSEVLRQTVTDSTAYRRFIRGLKRHQIYGPLLWPNRLDSVQLRRGMNLIESGNNMSKGGAK